MSEKRGFAVMDAARHKEIASMGGKAAQASGKCHRFTSEKAAEAGRKGGRIAHAKGTAHKFTHQQAVEAGRKGGLATAKRSEN